MLIRNRSTVFNVFIRRRLVGLVLCSIKRERYTLHTTMGVLMSHWGKSIGTQLLQAMFTWATANRFYRIELRQLEKNNPPTLLIVSIRSGHPGMDKHRTCCSRTMQEQVSKPGSRLQGRIPPRG